MTKEDFVKTMLFYHKAITPKMDDDQIDMLIQIWVHDLDKYSIEQLKTAWSEYRKENTFLSLADLIKILDAEEEVEYDFEALTQWQAFLVELRHRPSENIKFEDPITAYIADSIMSIRQLKITAMDSELGILQNRFVKEYKSLRSKPSIFKHIQDKGVGLLTGFGRRMLEAKASGNENLLEAGA